MPIHIDVISVLDERSMALNADKLVATYGVAGERAAKAFEAASGQFGTENVTAKISQKFSDAGTKAAANFGTAFNSGLLKEMPGTEWLERATHGYETTGGKIGALAGKATGIAFMAEFGAALAGGAGLLAIGDLMEDINRGVTLATAASGQALDDLKAHADALVGSLDTSTKSLGNDMATLATRLHTGAGPALDTLTGHVEMLRDRFGSLNVQALGGAFVQFGVGIGDADNVLASLTASTREAAIPLGDMLNNLVSLGPTLQESGLNIEQSGHLIAAATAAMGSPTKAITGFEMAMKAAHQQGQSLADFMPRVAASLQHYADVGDKVSADAVALDVFGTRKWAEAKALADAYMETVKAGPDAYRANGKELDELKEKTQTLHNRFDLLKNKIEAALAPVALNVVDDISGKMDEFVAWLSAHQDDLRNFFQTSVSIIEHVLEVLGNIATELGRHPGLVQAIGIAFATWEVGSVVGGVVKGLQAMSALLTGMPAEAAAAGSGVAAGLAPALAAISAVATALALFNLHGDSAPGSIGPGASERQRKLDAGRDYAAAHGGQVPPGYGQWLDKPGAPTPPGLDQYYVPGAAAGTPFFDAQGRGLDAQGKPFGGPGAPNPTPYSPDMPKSIAPGAADAIPGMHPPGTPGAPGEIPGGLLSPEDLEKQKKGPKGPRLPEAPEVPYGAGFGAPPRPGETAEQYEKEQRLLDLRHTLDTDQARLLQLEQTNTATADDIQKARNKVVKDEEEINAAQLQSLKKHSSEMEDFGAKIDKDFGVSKGLAGIADNLVKFIGNLTMAPVMGALEGVYQSAGGKKGTGGAGGLIGMAALASGMGAGFGGAEAGIPSFSYPGNPTSAAEFGAAGNRVGALYAFANSMVGTPYSTQLRNDCSGMVSKLANVALGLPPAVSFDTTSEGAWLQQHGFQQGVGPPGSFQVGWNPQPGMSGHTAATLPGGEHAEQGGSNSAFTLGPHAAGGESGQFPMHAYLPMGGYAPGYAQGAVPISGGPSGTDTIPAWLSPHESVMNPDATERYGPQLAAMNAGHYDVGAINIPMAPPSPPPAPTPPPAPVQPRVLPYIDPSTAGAGPASPTGLGPGPAGGGAPNAQGTQTTPIGGVDPPQHASGSRAGSGGGAAGGAAVAAASMMPGAGVAAQIGVQEISRAIQAAGAYAGIGVSGLMQTVLPTGASQLASNSWVTKVAGGLVGAMPQLPNMAGKPSDPSQAAAGQARDALPPRHAEDALTRVEGGGDTTNNTVHNAPQTQINIDTIHSHKADGTDIPGLLEQHALSAGVMPGRE